jgi:hypothetical protein
MKTRKKKMSLTLEELKNELKQLDELTLLELLNISSEEIVNHFSRIIELNQEELREELGEDD